jgi:hypothetical protein
MVQYQMESWVITIAMHLGHFCLRVPSRHSTAVYVDTEHHPLPTIPSTPGHTLLPSKRDLHLDLTINLEIM